MHRVTATGAHRYFIGANCLDLHNSPVPQHLRKRAPATLGATRWPGPGSSLDIPLKHRPHCFRGLWNRAGSKLIERRTAPTLGERRPAATDDPGSGPRTLRRAPVARREELRVGAPWPDARSMRRSASRRLPTPALRSLPNGGFFFSNRLSVGLHLAAVEAHAGSTPPITGRRAKLRAWPAVD